jgi:alpha-ribazole phosphatase
MTKLLLIRHGQTDWNLEGRYQGQSDIPLNQNGRAQAKALANQIQLQTFAAVFTSDLKRAQETAEILATAFHLQITIDPRLREINQGEWEGLFVNTIKARYVDLWSQRAIEPANIRPPGGETVAEVATRVYAALDDISRLFPVDNILIVSHGLSLATIICRVQGIPVGQAYTVIPDNVQPFWVEWKPSV